MKDFKPTEAMRTAAKVVFLAMAYTETIRPIVEGYQKEILDFYQWEIAPEWADRRGSKETIILDPDRTYLLTEDDFTLYMKECAVAMDKASLTVDNPEHCPLLVAEDIQRLAARVLINTMEPITNLKAEDIHRPEQQKELVNLSLRLLAPFVDPKL